MAEDTRGDFVLAPGEYALLQDTSSSRVSVLVGPTTQTVSANEQLVVYNPKDGSYQRAASPDVARKRWPDANQVQYIILTNPGKAKADDHPAQGKQGAIPELEMGVRINLPGPATFPLWPGQSAQVLDGHSLRTNQYLLLRVINGEVATKNWESAIVDRQTTSSGHEETKPQPPTPPANVEVQTVPSGEGQEEEASTVSAEAQSQTPEQAPAPEPSHDREGVDVLHKQDGLPKLSTGQLIVVKGTDVSFYIPPTGVEVVPDEGGKYVRDAVTLRQLEYCILVDENGTEEFLRGPAVVFPKPTQTFVKGADGSRKFRAVELNDQMGIYIKVTRDYEEGGKQYKQGEELFITGKEQRIYFPRAEHSLIKYDDVNIIHYGIAIPAGEGRYILDRNSGKIDLVEGPRMLLPDPRFQVVVRRVLSRHLVKLLYPDNQEALQHNINLMAATTQSDRVREDFEDDDSRHYRSKGGGSRGLIGAAAGLGTLGLMESASQELVPASEFARKNEYTPPRTISLESTKYDGAVAVGVWTGYAIKIVDKTGQSRVVAGPNTALLDYDETVEIFELSTGRPKSRDRIHRDVYLRVRNNTVSDVVSAETADFVAVQIPISYRVNFEDNEQKWFDVEDYVGYLTDRMRSMIINRIKQIGIRELNTSYINIVRDLVLGASNSDGTPREGRYFDENNMHIYDVELGQLNIGDFRIAELLHESQQSAVTRTLKVEDARHELDATEEMEDISRRIADAKAETAEHTRTIAKQTVQDELELALARLQSEADQEKEKLEAEDGRQDLLNSIEEADIERHRKRFQAQLEEEQERIELRLKELMGEAEALVKKTGSVQPQLIAALQAFGDKDMITKVAKAMAPLTVFGDKNFMELLAAQFEGTNLAKTLREIGAGNFSQNGASAGEVVINPED